MVLKVVYLIYGRANLYIMFFWGFETLVKECDERYERPSMAKTKKYISKGFASHLMSVIGMFGKLNTRTKLIFVQLQKHQHLVVQNCLRS